jgi:hypothetical protein
MVSGEDDGHVDFLGSDDGGDPAGRFLDGFTGYLLATRRQDHADQASRHTHGDLRPHRGLPLVGHQESEPSVVALASVSGQVLDLRP